MNLLCLLPGSGPEHELYSRMVRESWPRSRMEIFDSAADLGRRLAEPLADCLLLAVCGDMPELEALAKLRRQLKDLPLVLVVPDDHELTLSQGHSLAPRLLASLDCPAEEVLAVVLNLGRRLTLQHEPTAATA